MKTKKLEKLAFKLGKLNSELSNCMDAFVREVQSCVNEAPAKSKVTLNIKTNAKQVAKKAKKIDNLIHKCRQTPLIVEVIDLDNEKRRKIYSMKK